MKKRMILWLVLAAALAGCGVSSDKAGRPQDNRPAGVNDVIEQEIAKENGDGWDNTSLHPETEGNDKNSSVMKDPNGGEKEMSDVDIDLTVLSGTMVYSEVYNMMVYPEMYIGKTVKMKGPFAYYYDEATGNYYFACIIQDATACCAQGIEFVLTEDYTYPDDYPEFNREICVVGVFDTYQEGQYTYCTLRNAVLI